MTAATVERRAPRSLSRASTASALPWIRDASTERRREWHGIVTDNRQRAARRRERVLAQPDLAEELRAAMGYLSADQWSGYVPPSTDDSPVRRELIRILHAVANKEQEPR